MDDKNILNKLNKKTETENPPRTSIIEVFQAHNRRRDGLISREEWLSENETIISDAWEGMQNYIRDTNSNILDKCSYVDFSDFIAKYSTHFGDNYNYY